MSDGRTGQRSILLCRRAVVLVGRQDVSSSRANNSGVVRRRERLASAKTPLFR